MRTVTYGTVMLLFGACGAYGGAIGLDLGTAGSFSVLAGSTVTNTGDTVLRGSLGVSPGDAVSGFLPGVVYVGTTDAGDSVAAQAESDLAAAYSFAGEETCPLANNLSGKDLGGLTLTPGVYCFSSSAGLTGILTLDGQGDPNAVFLFQIESALTANNDSSVDLVNSAAGANVFWAVGSSATLGSDAAMKGELLAYSSITLGTSASIECGSALALHAAVTLDSNSVSVCATPAVPEPGSGLLLASGMLLGLCLVARGRARGF